MRRRRNQSAPAGGKWWVRPAEHVAEVILVVTDDAAQHLFVYKAAIEEVEQFLVFGRHATRPGSVQDGKHGARLPKVLLSELSGFHPAHGGGHAEEGKQKAAREDYLSALMLLSAVAVVVVKEADELGFDGLGCKTGRHAGCLAHYGGKLFN